jgi:hypothetical protein
MQTQAPYHHGHGLRPTKMMANCGAFMWTDMFVVEDCCHSIRAALYTQHKHIFPTLATMFTTWLENLPYHPYWICVVVLVWWACHLSWQPRFAKWVQVERTQDQLEHRNAQMSVFDKRNQCVVVEGKWNSGATEIPNLEEKLEQWVRGYEAEINNVNKKITNVKRRLRTHQETNQKLNAYSTNS